MMGGRAEVCPVCGQAFLAGCVMGEPCPDCESKDRRLLSAGWTCRPAGFSVPFPQQDWEDPRFPGKMYPRSEALRLQDGRDLESRPGGSDSK